MAKALIACFDGAWNTPDEMTVDDGYQVETNVRRMYESIRDRTADGREQKKWYDAGVGIEWYDRLVGGAFGLGLSRNIRQGYEFLVEHYEDGDEIFLVGFSRGAYTARSLVGLVRNCGLLKRTDKVEILTAYEIYRTRDDSADSETAIDFRREHSREVRIKFLGVWDTVGVLGIPVSSFGAFNRSLYEFHDTELSSIVENAYHALALDEHRKDYQATLWSPGTKPRQTMEQRWFVGAHGDVGGGYKDRTLSDITLEWMQARARGVGLGLDPGLIPTNTASNYLGAITDSYKRFLGGAYSRFNPRYFRDVCQTTFGSEVVDGSVPRRLASDLTYRPRNRGL